MRTYKKINCILFRFTFSLTMQTISKICDCGKGSDTSDTEMSTHSQQQLQGMPGTNSQGGLGVIDHNHLAQQRMDGSRILSLSRQPVDLRNHDGIYSKQMGLVGIHPSPGKFFIFHYVQKKYLLFFVIQPYMYSIPSFN